MVNESEATLIKTVELTPQQIEVESVDKTAQTGAAPRGQEQDGERPHRNRKLRRPTPVILFKCLHTFIIYVRPSGVDQELLLLKVSKFQ